MEEPTRTEKIFSLLGAAIQGVLYLRAEFKAYLRVLAQGYKVMNLKLKKKLR